MVVFVPGASTRDLIRQFADSNANVDLQEGIEGQNVLAMAKQQDPYPLLKCLRNARPRFTKAVHARAIVRNYISTVISQHLCWKCEPY